eukprot:m.380050 g.380050  ORF g.380050 m.380050 type:complete len:560 (-) comp56222_c0_seq4:4410-6089(-)
MSMWIAVVVCVVGSAVGSGEVGGSSQRWAGTAALPDWAIPANWLHMQTPCASDDVSLGPSAFVIISSGAPTIHRITIDTKTKLVLKKGSKLSLIATTDSRYEQSGLFCGSTPNSTATPPSSSASTSVPQTTDISDSLAASSSSNQLGTIVGSVVGSLVLLTLVVVVVLLRCRHVVSETRRSSQPLLLGALTAQEIQLSRSICVTAWATVYCATYQNSKGEKESVIVEQHNDSTTLAQYRSEVSALTAGGPHPNIVRFLGQLQEASPYSVLLEPMPLGNLRDYLRQFRTQQRTLTFPEQASFVRQIAVGMCFLETRAIVHAHLASRCVLVGDGGLCCKIAEIGRHQMLSQRGLASIPRHRYAWTAPEVHSSAIYSLKSDVYAFGVTVWEVMTFAATPFLGVSDRLFTNQAGLVSLPSVGVGATTERTIAVCMERDPKHRPSFQTLGHWMRDMANELDSDTDSSPSFPASRFEIDDLMEEEQGYEPFSSTPQTAAVWERTEWPTLTRPLAFTAKTLPYANEDDWIGSRTDSHEHSLPSSPVGLQQDRLSDAEELQFGFDCE